MIKDDYSSLFNKELKPSYLMDYIVEDFNSLEDIHLDADLIIADPPFGINFSGKASNYNRDSKNVVDGYREWYSIDYSTNVNNMIKVIYNNLNGFGSALIFSGWQNSSIISYLIDLSNLHLQGKLYFTYNFAPACKKRPSHNVYEIFWITKDKKKWTYNNRCSTHHCQEGEKNLSVFNFKREYYKGMIKYPTRLPIKLLVSLIEHFTNEGDFVLDIMAGSGVTGIASILTHRNFMLYDVNVNGKNVFAALIDMFINGKSKYFIGDKR